MSFVLYYVLPFSPLLTVVKPRKKNKKPRPLEEVLREFQGKVIKAAQDLQQELADSAEKPALDGSTTAADEDPVLLAHGRHDGVVPYKHSVRMQDALEAAGKKSEIVLYEDWHGFIHQPNRVDFYTRLRDFLQTCTA